MYLILRVFCKTESIFQISFLVEERNEGYTFYKPVKIDHRKTNVSHQRGNRNEHTFHYEFCSGFLSSEFILCSAEELSLVVSAHDDNLQHAISGTLVVRHVIHGARGQVDVIFTPEDLHGPGSLYLALQLYAGSIIGGGVYQRTHKCRSLSCLCLLRVKEKPGKTKYNQVNLSSR